MNGLEKPFRKKSDPKKNEKNSKNQRQIATCEQKTASEKANFCSNTVFSLYFKNHENVWTDLKKKDSAPIQFKFFEL